MRSDSITALDAYLEAGFSVIPLQPGKKNPVEPAWSQFCRRQPPADLVARWKDTYTIQNIGLCLGTEMREGLFIAAIDIDDEEYITPVLHAVNGAGAPAKVGSKGRTLFCLSDSSVSAKKFNAKDENGKSKGMAVEILAAGNQTVIPPSIHPTTKQPYRWIEHELLGNLDACPVINCFHVDEIAAVVSGKGATFLELNTMQTNDGEGGGNVHNTCLVVVATMVARGWPDDAIQSRVERAVSEAYSRAGKRMPDTFRAKIAEWIDSAREKGMTGTVSKKKEPAERRMANWAMENLGGAAKVVTVDGILRQYKDGYWPRVDLGDLQRNMLLSDSSLKNSDVQNAIHILHTLTQKQGFGRDQDLSARDDEKRQRICLSNGTLNLRTGMLEAHDPCHELRYRIPVAWNPSAMCATYDSVLDFTFAGDPKAIATWEEFAALTLVDDMSFQKLLFLKGPGGNGKGTLSKVLRMLHDPDNIGSVAVTDLENERKRTSLVGKLVNISGEQSRLNLLSDTYLKKITGEDPIDVRRLYGEVDNNVYLSARFIEMVNEMPATSDTSRALERRMIILSCPNKVTKPDPTLDAKLRADLPGILRRCVAALANLYERGSFDPPQSSIQEVTEYLRDNDPVAGWLEDRCEECGEDEAVPVGDLYADFRGWCDMMGFRQPYTAIYFGRKLAASGFPPLLRRFPSGSMRCRAVRVLKGLGSV